MNKRWRALCCGLGALAVLYFKGADATVGTDPLGSPAAAEEAQRELRVRMLQEIEPR